MNLVEVFDSISAKLQIDFDYLTSQIEHRQSKGRLREIEVVEEFLRIYLPRSVGIGHGEIINTSGQVSNESDIIFYEAQGCPTLIEKTGYQVFPIECVYGVAEVKSVLDGRELADAFLKLSAIKRFPKTAFIEDKGPIQKGTRLYGKEWSYFPTVGIVFAYDSIGLTTLSERLREHQVGVPMHQRIDLITVLKKGLIVNWNDKDRIVEYSPSEGTRIRALESSNPLLLTVVILQTLFQGTWMPKFRIRDYFGSINYGNFLE